LAEALKLLEECAADLRAVGWPEPARYLRIERFVNSAFHPTG
jgi:hypothetical protein